KLHGVLPQARGAHAWQHIVEALVSFPPLKTSGVQKRQHILDILHPPTLSLAQRRAIEIKVEYFEWAKPINIDVATFMASRQRDTISRRGRFDVDRQLVLERADRLNHFAMRLWCDFQHHVNVESLRTQHFEHHGRPTDQVQTGWATQPCAQLSQ